MKRLLYTEGIHTQDFNEAITIHRGYTYTQDFNETITI